MDVETILEQGIGSFRSEDWSRALACFDAVLHEQPRRNDVLNHKARTYERLGHFDAALECLDRALAIDPYNAADLRNRAIVLRKLHRPAEALASYQKLLALRPEDGDALAKAALLLNELGRRDEALAVVDHAVRVSPDNPDILNSRVIVLDNLGRYEEALRDIGRILRIQPSHIDAINNTGMLAARLGRFEEALRHYDRSLAIKPDQAQASYNRSLVRLCLGDWTRGFEEFESRWRTAPLQGTRLLSTAPLWLGRENLQGKTLLLYHEQGYGDTLQAIRYIPQLAKRGTRVLLAVPQALYRLAQTVPGVTHVIAHCAELPHHDFHTPLMSLPLALGTTPDRVPAPIPYLRPDPARVAQWDARLGPRTRLRIGIVWGGRRYAPINYPRDVPLEAVRTLLDLDAQFIGLQKDLAAEDRALLAQLPELLSLGETLEDFADAAALVANLDLVIAADTAIAHLAGALGQPIWLMNRYASCWRWLRAGQDSPWYPTLRQFRQPSVGDWSSVIGSIHRELSGVIAAKSQRTSMTSTPTISQRPAREKIRLVCATRLSSQDFFSQSPLGRSLPAYRTFPRDQSIELRLFADNRAGLSGLYNTAIEEARTNPAILVFIHDDVYLSDYYWADHLQESLRSFELVGLAGNRRRVARQPSWMYLDAQFTRDEPAYLSGVLGHGKPFPDLAELSVYGEPRQEVKLLDGVLLAIRSQLMIERELRFDPRFQFHFYDLDICRQAELRGIKMGTCAVSVVHASIGRLGTPAWRAAYDDYCAKYNES
jgi:tetratricopeptide (TPR) repeat protein